MKRHELGQSLATALLLLIFSALIAVSAMAADYVCVNNDGVNLRSAPDIKATILYELPAGYPLKVLKRKGKWLKVSDFENDKGWIFSSLVSKSNYVIVKVKEGNVRSGPGKNYQKIGTVAREVILRRLKTKGDWVKVRHPKLTGWIYKTLLWP